MNEVRCDRDSHYILDKNTDDVKLYKQQLILSHLTSLEQNIIDHFNQDNKTNKTNNTNKTNKTNNTNKTNKTRKNILFTLWMNQ